MTSTQYGSLISKCTGDISGADPDLITKTNKQKKCLIGELLRDSNILFLHVKYVDEI